MIMEKVEDAVMQHNKKMTWLSDEENRENRSHSPPAFIKLWFLQCCGAEQLCLGSGFFF